MRCALPIIATLLFLLTVNPNMSPAAEEQKFPDIIAVDIRPGEQDAFHFEVTVSSPYDTHRRYADAFRIMGKDGTVFGTRILAHDHASEQPFTRYLYGVTIPRGVTAVVVQGRDMKYGYGGKTVEAVLPGR